MPRLRLTAIDEGYSVVVSTKLSGADSPGIVLDALLKLFPDFTCGLPEEPTFPSNQDDVLAAEGSKFGDILRCDSQSIHFGYITRFHVSKFGC